MTVGEIVKQWLEDHGCDGLCDPDFECGCGIDDLNPCGGLCDDCIPARRVEGEVGKVYVPIEDDELAPTSQERIEQRLREALEQIDRLAGVGASDLCGTIADIVAAALKQETESEDERRDR